MKVTRTIEINDLSPSELADIFSEYEGWQQAQFFARVWDIAKAWPGAGWCQQSSDIIRSASSHPGATDAIRTLASHLPAEDVAYIVAGAVA